MAAFVELLGGELLEREADGYRRMDTEKLLAGKSAVALYFSAHWCPPCRGFTPRLAEWYKKDLSSKGLEIVFISSDRDEASFQSYYSEHPWLALPFEARGKKEELSKKFKVQGIPSLIILDSEGKTITTEGRSAVSEDPTGEEFPWRPPSVEDVLGGAKIVGSGGKQLTLQEAMAGKKALGLYFSAHWCPPCRGFTPLLAEWYKKDLAAKGLEVIFISWDRSESEYKDYFAEMPWLSIDFNDKQTVKKLNSCFKVDGIPNLVILDPDLKTINTEGRSAVSSDPTGEAFPWNPKPVNDVSAGPGQIHTTPTIFVFCESSSVTEQQEIEVALASIGQKYLDKQKSTDSDLEFTFMTAKRAEGLSPSLRAAMGLPSLGGKKSLCGRLFSCFAPSKSMYQSKPGKVVPPTLALVDIPSNGAFYLAPEVTLITEAAVEKFIDDFLAGKLQRKQLT
eukprot:TRINITY_DN11655_c0_g1_i1.p1 TRINITY_DN11655_c0_g1~~TRINITY_DN11655_c0_g1_i1.p1  ORF type:complete len:450 (+),score=108.58 TRINITY_DN11655_c0_g1_i1:67-1416(+)